MTKKFKILFLTPPYKIKDRYNNKLNIKKGYLPPLGLAYLATMLENENDIKIMDLQLYDYPKEKILQLVEEYNPDLLCFQTLTPTAKIAFEIVDYIKTKLNIPTIFGGAHVSCFPEQTLKEQKSIDIIVIGEGEHTLLEVVEHFKNNKPLKSIDGIAFRDKEKIIKTPPREVIQNLDELPIPKRKFFDLKKYIPLPNQYKELPLANMITSRGCSYGQCTYCFEAGRLGHKYRRISVNRAIEEIKYLIREYNIKEISFWDDNLIGNLGDPWVGNFCDKLIEENIDIKWSCYARVNLVNPELLNRMAKAGCWNIFYGIESGNQELLNKIKKGITIDQIKSAIKNTREAGIESRGSFMLALPGETPEMAEKTINFAIELDVDYAQFLLTTPFPGTVLFEQCRSEGRLSLNYNDYNVFKPVFVPHGYKDEKEIIKMHKRAYRKFYLRPSYVLKHIKKIRSWTDINKYLTGLKFVLGMS